MAPMAMIVNSHQVPSDSCASEARSPIGCLCMPCPADPGVDATVDTLMRFCGPALDARGAWTWTCGVLLSLVGYMP
jgi:hypothetical protein